MQTKAIGLKEELNKYGISKDAFHHLGDESSSKNIEYLDLITPPRPLGIKLDGVIESQDQPLLYIVNESQLSQPAQESDYQRIRHALACRGQRAYLARLQPGKLHVVPVNLNSKQSSQEQLPWREYQAGQDEALTFFPRLAFGIYDGAGESRENEFVFKRMFDSLNGVANSLAGLVNEEDVFSLVGRALFFRFLRDRDIIKDEDCKKIAPGSNSLDECFITSQNLFSTSRWLDKTFNGNFLPLDDNGESAYFAGLNKKVFDELNVITLGHDPVGNGVYQFRLFRAFDFAHIPVGLLSQVYEKFAVKWDPYAPATSVHYTPRNIATTLVEEVFEGMSESYNARVLDPACGAGVFLVLAFRRLYQELWRTKKERPQTSAIRGILENQITGFDISDSALKLAALSLYLTAIELDPNPIPPYKLKFKDLNNTTLHNARKNNDPKGEPVIGSLDPSFGKQYNSCFDIVIGNPPWTKVDKDLAVSLQKISKDIIRNRGSKSLAERYHNPDNGPDLPFLWKATEWAKPHGRIAMALPARILLKQEKYPAAARKTLFQTLQVNGIINCSNLSDTPVWPEMSQPFMLLFATNQKPQKDHALHFVTPQYDATLNQRGEMWIDSKSAIPIRLQDTFEDTWTWKALTVGTSFDVDVLRKISSASRLTVKDYWDEQLKLASCNGYQIKEDQEQRDATLLQTLPNLNDTSLFKVSVDASQLERFSRQTLYGPRLVKIGDRLRNYRAPLMLLKESASISRAGGRALLSLEDVAYNQSFYGYSAANHPEGETLTRYLLLFAHTQIWMFYALMTTPKLGAERRTIYKSTFDNCPFVPFELLTDPQKKRILRLSNQLLDEKDIFNEIDTFFADIFALNESDIEVIRDTLEMGMPYKESRMRACSPATHDQAKEFTKRLENLLAPFFDVIHKKITANIYEYGNASHTYIGIFLGDSKTSHRLNKSVLWEKVITIAEENGSTQIYLEGDQGLFVAILNQQRYWTQTRARLCASDILRNYMEIFED